MAIVLYIQDYDGVQGDGGLAVVEEDDRVGQNGVNVEGHRAPQVEWPQLLVVEVRVVLDRVQVGQVHR
ncbi:MAG: hypothetical protein GY696_23695 [Gammaproteobacteria bacterium]|nr:hypothetical protein [Gammaproteobacteria bacterium]